MVVMGGQKIQYQIESFTTVVGQKLGHLADFFSTSPGQETEVVRGGEDCGRPIRPTCTLLLDRTAYFVFLKNINLTFLARDNPEHMTMYMALELAV